MVRTTTRHAVILIGLLVAAAVVYAPLRDAPLVYEDANWMPVVQAGAIAVEPRPSRALTYLTFRWTYDRVNFTPGAWHLTNVAIHLVNGVLVYALAASLVGAPAALGAAGLFLLHPLNSEAVSYVTARADLLSTFFVLVAVLCALGRRVWVLRSVGCVLALACAMVSKETAVVGIPLVLITVFCWRRGSVPWLAPLFAVLWVGVGACIGAVWEQIQIYLSIPSFTSGSSLPVQEYALYQAGMVWKLLLSVLWPAGLTIDHDVLQFGTAWLALSAMGVLVALIVAVASWGPAPQVTGGVCWVALALAPRFLVRTNEFVTEPQMYLALVGVWISVSAVVTSTYLALVNIDHEFWDLYNVKHRVNHGESL